MLEVFKNEISHLSVSKNVSERDNCNYHNNNQKESDTQDYYTPKGDHLTLADSINIER